MLSLLLVSCCLVPAIDLFPALSYRATPWSCYNSRELFFGSALTRAAAKCEPLSFAANELAVRLEHIEVSLKLAGEHIR